MNLASLLNNIIRNRMSKGAGVNTPEEEALWERAKAAVDKEHGGHEGKWALVQHIYQQMKAGHHDVSKAGVMAITLAPPVSPLTGKLLELLAATQTLSTTAQHFHWNVKGPHFHSLHEFFGELYDSSIAAEDEIAERVRAIGSDVPARAVVGIDTPVAEAMVAELVRQFELSSTLCREVGRMAESLGDQATIDLVGKRQRECDKAAWMLRATLGQQSRPMMALAMIAKAAREYMSAPWVEIPESMALGLIAKGKSHKYLKRVPTGKTRKNGNPIYRYYYKVTSGTAAHEHFKVGSAFADKKIGQHGGHWHIKANEGGKLHLKHDETGEERHVTADELSSMLHEAHGLGEHAEAKKQKALSDLKAARENKASAKTIDAAKKRAHAAGATEEDTMSESEKTPKATSNPILEKLIARAEASNPAQRAQTASLPDMEPEHFEDFKRDVADMVNGGGSADLQRLVKIWGSDFPNLYQFWLSEKQRPLYEARQAEKERNMVQVRAFKEGSPQQPKKMSKEDAAAWVKPGHVVVEKSPNISGHGFDRPMGASFSIRTYAVGDEIPEGTVKAKRMVKHHGGEWTVEYLVKPKAGGGKQPTAAQKLKEAERDLAMNADYMSPEQRAEARAKLDALRASVR